MKCALVILFPLFLLQSQSAEQELAEAKRLMVEEEKVNDEHRRRVSEVLTNAEPQKVSI